MERLELAFALFDEYNRQDPNTVVREGINYPAEHFYALQLYKWVKTLAPDAGEVLLLASRCQHIGRWQSPRSGYPAGKAGYLRWRTELAKFHADVAEKLMKEAGYDAETIGSLRSILLKEGLRTNPDMQTMENALCLVFLEFQYEDFLALHDEEKMVRILKKSWGKMTEPGRQAALGLSFSEKGTALIGKALSG
ncbi:MAG: DUF4202 domain-containing protein [Puia sp.]|nr:DUF4202 domain-containing protein [Puia sp.]